MREKQGRHNGRCVCLKMMRQTAVAVESWKQLYRMSILVPVCGARSMERMLKATEEATQAGMTDSDLKMVILARG